MGIKLKFNEDSKGLTINVPESQYTEIRNKFNDILNNKDNLNLFLTIDIIDLMKLFKKIRGFDNRDYWINCCYNWCSS